MPSNVLFMDTLFPHITEEDSTEAAIKKILNYDYLLREQLQHTLFNLGAENFNEVEWDNLTQPIFASIGNSDYKLTELSLATEGLALRVSDAERGIAELTVTSDGISTRVTNAENSITTLTQSVDSIGFTVSSTTSSGQTSSVIQMTKDGTVIGSGTINAVNKTQAQSLIDVSIDSLSLGVTNRSGYSYVTLKSDGVTIATSDDITLGGDVVFVDDLTDGVTKISGDNIRTGTIDASRVSVEDAFEVLHNGTTYGYMGYGTGSNTGGQTRGVIMESSPGGNYFLATDGGVRMQSGECIYCTDGGDIKSSVAIQVESDERVKKDIVYDMGRYEQMFLALRPCAFRMVKGSSGRYHTGFIAQEVEEAITNNGLSTLDLAALVKETTAEGYSEENPLYSIRYSELIALNTHMIQRLWNRVEELEAALVQ